MICMIQATPLKVFMPPSSKKSWNWDSVQKVWSMPFRATRFWRKLPARRSHSVPGRPVCRCKMVSGISFLEPVFAALGLDPYPRLVLVDALELSQAHVPAFPPDMPALIAQIYSRMVAAEVKVTLNAVYPDEHPVRLVHAAGTPAELVEDLPLYEIDRSEHIGLLTVLYVPPLGEGTSFEAFQEIIAHLRAPDGCPWDKEQTHQSLRASLLEESYEALAALDSEDPHKMTEEFGDLLLQIVLNAQIASEEGEFGMADVFKGIYDKIIRRHPHVFGETQVDGVGSVLKNWEKLKAEERLAATNRKKACWMVFRWRCRPCSRPRNTRTGLPGLVLTGRRSKAFSRKLPRKSRKSATQIMKRNWLANWVT